MKQYMQTTYQAAQPESVLINRGLHRINIIQDLHHLKHPVEANKPHANLILENKFTKPGISPPEYLGNHYEFISNYLKKRSVIYEVSKKTIENIN